MAACTAEGPPESGLEAVDRPSDLADLDLGVQRQFETLWQQLDEARREASDTRHSRAWGGLGLFFQVYRYSTSAGAAYRNAHRLDPLEPRWPYHLGTLAEDAGELEAATEYYERAAELAPEVMTPRVRLGELALQRQDLEEAASTFRRVLEQEKENAGAVFGLARVALARGEAHAAVEPLEALARRQPDASPVRYALAVAYRQLGRDDEASRHLELLPEENFDQNRLEIGGPWEDELQKMDRGARNLTRRGVSAFRRGRNLDAALLLGQAVTADPEGPDERINYAIALQGLGRPVAAMEQVRLALDQAEPASEAAGRAHVLLGRLLATRGRLEQATTHLEAAFAIDPRSTPVRLELGRIALFQQRYEEALEHYAAVRELSPELAAPRFWHAATLLLLGRDGAALRALEEDLRAVGDDRRLRLLSARLLSAAGQAEIRDVERASRLLADGDADEEAGVFYAETVAMVTAERGDFDEAVRWQRAAVEALAGIRPRQAAQRARRRLVLYEEGEPCRTPWEERESIVERPVSLPAEPGRPGPGA